MKVGRWRMDRHPWSRRYGLRRVVLRRGGRFTTGPWWELSIPFLGSVVLSRDVSLFGHGRYDEEQR